VAIKLKDLETSSDTTRAYTFKDCKLDFEEIRKTGSKNLFQRPQGSDIQASIDEGCIKNSLTNLFNTMPGEKILNPIYGLGLQHYLFKAVSDETARDIGQSVAKGVEQFEPRVSIISININTDEDAGQYTIEMVVRCPSLKQNLTLSGTLESKGFIFK